MKKRYTLSKLKKTIIVLMTTDIICAVAIGIIGYRYASELTENRETVVSDMVEDIGNDMDVIKSNLIGTVSNSLTWIAIKNPYSVDGVEAFSGLQSTYDAVKDSTGREYNFFLSTEKDKIREITPVHAKFEKYSVIKSYLKKEIYESDNLGIWRLGEVDGVKFLYTYYRYHQNGIGTYVIGAWILQDDLAGQLLNYSYNNYTITLEQSNSDLKTTGNISNTVYTLGNTNGEVCLRVREAGISFYYISMLPTVIVILIALSMIGLAISLYAYMYGSVLRPMERFSNFLAESRNIEEAEDYIRQVDLDDAYQLLQRLIEQTGNLKNELYEEELKRQKIELDFRKVQIKPHFLINCLSGIYFLVEHGETERAKTMLVQVSDYLRQLLTDGLSLIPFGQELKFVTNYIEIQSSLSAGRIFVETEVDDAASESMFPTLLLSTFAENSVHQARKIERDMTIKIRGSVTDDGVLYVCLKDDGGGYPDAILKSLNNKEKMEEQEGHHLGINNSIVRLELMYQGLARYRFSNRDGGACVEFWVPEE